MKDISEYKITKPMSSLEIIKESLIPLIKEDHRRIRMGHWFKTDHPTCGTVACIAGWVCYALGTISEDEYVSVKAKRLVPPHLRAELYNGFLGGTHFYTPDGTPEQAEAVIQFLESFCERREKDLKCWILDPTGEGLGSEDREVK